MIDTLRRFFVSLIALAAIAPPVAVAAERWPQWGGTGRDFAVDARELSRDWGESGPPVLWERKLGGGFAAVVSDGKRLYTAYRDGDDEVAIALNRKNGRTVWEHRDAAPVPESQSLSTQYGRGPNATPLIAGDRIVTLGFTGQLRCIDTKRGRLIWSHDLGTAFDVSIPYFGHAASPLRVDDRVIVVAGGVLAFDLESGELAWQNREHRGNYASPRLITLADGSRQIVAALHGRIVGLDPADGEIVWEHEHANQWGTILSSPVVDPRGRVFVSAAEVGSALLDPSRPADAKRALWATAPTKIAHSNAVLGDGLVYASPGGKAGFVSATSLATGEQLWKARGFSTVNLLRVGDEYLLLDFEGELALVRLDADGMEVVTRASINDAPTWTPPTLLGTTLYVRDEARLVALGLGR